MRGYFLVFTFLFITCLGYAQDRPSTAASNVIVLEEPFDMPGLDRKRTVRLYLPPGYNGSTKDYPVLYMHDGQNLFDYATSYVGEWKVDETLNELAESKGLEMIVVGIDNGQSKRNSELNPYPNPRINAIEGPEYMAFIVDVLKPHIDKNYRTIPDREHTGLMGSSLGGLITHYGIYQYPEIFSKAGIFSPSFWVNMGKVKEMIKENPLPADTKLYFSIGDKEGMMVPSMKEIVAYTQEQELGIKNLVSYVVPNAEHNEAQWQGEFKKAVLWLFESK